LAEDPNSRTRGLDELLDSGMLVFEAYRDRGKLAEADAALTDMQSFAAKVGSPTFFYYASDKLITYMLETNRKPLAMETYLSALIKAGKDLPLKGQQTDAIERLKNREKHYKILQETAPELLSVEAWFPGERQTLQALRGKVVLLDFWATWCAPCFDAFPALSEWHQDLGPEGLVILGITRFYGQAEGFRVDNPNEIDFLKRFKAKQKLGYDFVVLSDQQSQMAYGATALPTAILIDRKGKIRYIEAGTSTSRIEDLRQMILKLLAEK
jgi:thiol-disulfide isomerase/thioredoxin